MLIRKSKLPRLPHEWYREHAIVLWTHTFEGRATGWLSEHFHCRFREVVLHASARYSLACPIYALMPDHWHMVWMGLNDGSDQRLATMFLRKHVTPLLGAARLQDRPHDHVLREDERKGNAFMATCHYVQAYPVRAGLVDHWKEWPYFGAVIAGYPDLDPCDDDFWERFWRIYGRVAGPT